MNDSIWQKIAETPWWVYPLIFYVIYIAYLSTKPKIVPLYNLFFSAAAFLLVSIIGIVAFVRFDNMNLASYIVMFFLGGGLGWLHFRSLKIKAVAGEKKLVMPGSWFAVFFIIAFVTAQFYLQFPLSLNSDVLLHGQYSLLLMTLYGFFTGLFGGRIACALRIVKNGPFTPSPAR
jgi:hypothetical protein